MCPCLLLLLAACRRTKRLPPGDFSSISTVSDEKRGELTAAFLKLYGGESDDLSRGNERASQAYSLCSQLTDRASFWSLLQAATTHPAPGAL